MKITEEHSDWDLVIQPQSSWFDFKLKEVWRYRDLLLLFVRRDFVTVYKQTILGPIWFFLQPLLTTITFTIIFGTIAQLSTDGAPKLVFYMAGITVWNYFSSCLTGVSSVFNANASLFGKVYFPRLIMPLTIVISNLMKFGVQLLLFFLFVMYYYVQNLVTPNVTVLLFPIIIILMALIGLGLGLVLSSMTTKYKDLTMLIGFGVQLFMYATPVIYPLSTVPSSYLWLLQINPLTPLFEYMRYSFLGIGSFNFLSLWYPAFFAFVVMLFGIMVFNKVQRTFMDTV